jgi:spore coat-associated protein N
MSLKKRLTMGAMSATLGLSLVAGGTWAAFNDIEEVNASVAAGKLDLKLGKINNGDITFDVNNLKPGDTMTRTINLINDGTLAIDKVLLTIDDISFTDYIPQQGQAGFGDSDTHGTNSAIDYLKQFKVTVAKVGAESGSGGFPKDIILSDITLADLYQATTDDTVDAAARLAAQTTLSNSVESAYYQNFGLNVATINPDEWTGLPVFPRDDDRLELTIEFDEYSIRDGRGVEEQNKYQGDTVDVKFSFEATQWGGQEITPDDIGAGRKGTGIPGYVETNEEANNGDN